MRIPLLLCALITFAAGARLYAVPPLVSGDVLPAEEETFEWYVGVRFQKESGTINRQIPFTELVYGISDRQEITFETSYFEQKGEHGFGDSTVGTKYMFIKETQDLPGISAVFEITMPTGSVLRGLGNGSFDYDLLIPVQKTWGWFSALVNIGCTIAGPAQSGAVSRRNVVFASFAQEYEVAKKTKLLSEIYWENSDLPGEPSRLAAGVGMEQKLRDNFKVHGTIGKSLRDGNRGGPSLRVYVGFEWDFDAPWKRAAQ